MDPSSDPSSQQRMATCAQQLAVACTQALAIDGAVHLPTLVAGCARMSGSRLLRSFGLDLRGVPPGQVVLSAQAAEKTALLLRYCATAATHMGTAIPSDPPTPPPDTAATLKLDFLACHQRLEPVFALLQGQHALSDEEIAKAGAITTGALIHQFARRIEPGIAFFHASVGFTEGARTAPP